MPGGRLTGQDRQHIATWLAEGLGYAEIGRRLDRPASTIMREVTRNGGARDYRADRADAATRGRARRQKPAASQPEAERESDFTLSFTDLLVQQGLPRMVARVMACLYVTDSGSLTAAELVQRLRVSPASVSHAVTFLEQQGLISRQRAAGERRERYVIDDEIWIRSIRSALEMNEVLAAASRRGSEVFGAGTPVGARFASSAELLLLVTGSLQQVIDEWGRRTAP